MRVNWHDLAALCDSVIDSQWGERIEIAPWRSGTYASGSADTTREVATTVGELFFTAGDVTGLGGRQAGFNSSMVEADVRVSVPQAAVDASGAKQGDRVYAPDRVEPDASFEIDRILPDGTGRAMIHITRLKT